MNAALRPFHIFGFLLLGLVYFIANPLLGQAVTSTDLGTIEGHLYNAGTGAVLSRARVIAEGTGRETATDDYGVYRLTVPAGEVRLSVSYVGLETQSTAVHVSAGAVTQQDFDLKISGGEGTGSGESTVKLNAFTVVADRQMSAQAIAQNERKNAPNIKQVVAFDEFGDRGAEDIGELMRFLPGVGIIDGGQTASSVSLRGFPDANTSIQLNGAELASARGNSRTQSLLDVPVANTSRVEVTKVPVPDQPASGIGGSMNIITKSGFEVRQPVFNYKLYQLSDSYTGVTLDGGPRGPTGQLSPKYQQPSFDFGYLVPVNAKLALSFGGSHSWRLKPMERDDHLDTQSDWNFLGGFQRVSTWLSLANIVQSWSGQIGADWKVTDRDTISTNYLYRYVSNNILRLSYVDTYGAGATGNRSFTQGATTAVGTVAQGAGTNQETGANTSHLTVKYVHRGDTWHLDALGAFSRSQSFLADIDNGHFNAATSSISNLILRGEGTGEVDAQIPVRYSATTAAKVPVNVFSGSNFVLGNPTSNQNKVIADKYTGKLDFTKQFEGSVPVTLKTGLYVDQQVRDQKTYAKTWTFTPNGQTSNAAKLASNFDIFDTAFNDTAPTVFGNKVDWISLSKFYKLYQQHPDWFVLNEATYLQNYTANSRKLSETVSAAYIRGDVHLLNNKLLIVAGVRFEKTKDDGAGQLDDPTAQYQKDASGKILTDASGAPILITTDALGRAQLRYKERGARSIRTYDGFYPSLNFTYNLTDNILLRGAVTETIARPDIGNIIPGTAIADPTSSNLTITVNNTGLKPWTARGYDLSLETYQLKGGYGSIGVFQRDITDFFNAVSTQATPELLAQYGLPNDPTYLGYQITTLTNGGNAKITGFEFAYNQDLLFLPHWARGFQVFVNATKLRLQGGNQADFSAFAPSNYAAGLSFVRARFSIRLTGTYQGETRQALVAASAANGIPPGVYNYQGERLRIGVDAQYGFSKHFAVYGSMTDLIGPGLDITSRQYGANTPDYEKDRRHQQLGSIITMGVKGEF